MCHLCCRCSIDITTIPEISINLLMPHCSQFVKEESPTAQKREKEKKKKRQNKKERKEDRKRTEESELLISGVSGEGESFI